MRGVHSKHSKLPSLFNEFARTIHNRMLEYSGLDDSGYLRVLQEREHRWTNHQTFGMQQQSAGEVQRARVGAHVRAQNYKYDAGNGDASASYNKPGSIMHFLEENVVREPYILMLDADMVFVKPIVPIDMGATKGNVVSEYVPYMDPHASELARQFVDAKNKEYVQPVGWYHIFHRDDAKAISPEWFKYCAKMRTNPHLYWDINGSGVNISTGDKYVEFGKPPWISEMYGYSFAAADAHVNHTVTRNVVVYPRHMNEHMQPKILHYGVDFEVDGISFNKMSLNKFDIHECTGKFLGTPDKIQTRQDHHSLVVLQTINDGLCEFYKKECNLDVTCPSVAYKKKACLEDGCCDKNTNCWEWAVHGECESNDAYMKDFCPFSCGKCPAPLTRHVEKISEFQRRLTEIRNIPILWGNNIFETAAIVTVCVSVMLIFKTIVDFHYMEKLKTHRT